MRDGARHPGELEQLTMLAVVRLGDGAWGAEIQRELSERAGRDVALGTIYVTLSRLESKGLVRSWMGDSTPERGGKARRHYEIEPAGLDALHEAREAFARMWDGLAGPSVGRSR
jgi:PadR family transcriptional regulator PadR